MHKWWILLCLALLVNCLHAQARAEESIYFAHDETSCWYAGCALPDPANVAAADYENCAVITIDGADWMRLEAY